MGACDETSLISRTMTFAILFGSLFPLAGVRAADQPAGAADAPPVKAKPILDIPFFTVNDNRLTYSFIPKATDPGAFSVQPNGTVNGTTAKQDFAYTHFDVWAYGTNFFQIEYLKSDHNDPAGPCSNAGVLLSGAPADCAGALDSYITARSTIGFNQVFNTNAFTWGPLRNVSFEFGGDYETENTLFAPAKETIMAGLQFQFDLPYKGYFNVAPMAMKEWIHNAFKQCGLFGPGTPGVTCLDDGNVEQEVGWALETNYYMDLGFLPESMRYFALSGRAAWYGPRGNSAAPLPNTGVGRFSNNTVVEWNTEPIRLTFDASKAMWGAKYSHFLEFWVAYRYRLNKFGLKRRRCARSVHPCCKRGQHQ
jgi:hypothetical protein